MFAFILIGRGDVASFVGCRSAQGRTKAHVEIKAGVVSTLSYGNEYLLFFDGLYE